MVIIAFKVNSIIETCKCDNCDGTECCQAKINDSKATKIHTNLFYLLILCLMVILTSTDFSYTLLILGCIAISNLTFNGVYATGLDDICLGYNYFQNELSNSVVLNCSHTVNNNLVKDISIDKPMCI